MRNRYVLFALVSARHALRHAYATVARPETIGSTLTHVSGIWAIDVADMFPSADVRISSGSELAGTWSNSGFRFEVSTSHQHNQNGEPCPAGYMHALVRRRETDSCRVPPNCQFELDDMEQDWAWKENSFDLIFSRDLILAVRDWPRLVDQTYR